VSRFDAELYLRLRGEEMLVGGRERPHGPWDTPLAETARALVAVGAISAAKAGAVIADYTLADALRSEHGLQHRGPFAPGSRARRRKVKPLEPRRVVPCDQLIEHAQGTLRVRHVALAEHSTSLAITWRPDATQRRSLRRGGMFTFGRGLGGRLQATVVDDRGTRAGTHFGGGGSDQEWEGHLTTDRPLARDTAWIELDGTRLELSAEPAEWEVSIEELPAQPPAHAYLWRRLAVRRHFHDLESLDPVIDALLAAGALDPDDPVIDETYSMPGSATATTLAYSCSPAADRPIDWPRKRTSTPSSA
jgi:hypothetical protein